MNENQRKQESCDARIKKLKKDLEINDELIVIISSSLSNIKKTSLKIRKAIEVVL